MIANGKEWLEDRIQAEGEPDVIREEVRRKAGALVDLARAADPGWSPPPFDPRRFAAALDIPVLVRGDMPDLDAMLLPVPGGPRIALNGRVRHPGRLAFSLAHELAHLFFAEDEEPALHLRSRREDDYPTAEARRLERLCDLGAAELLMPAPEFLGAAQGEGGGAPAIPATAEAFAVSLEAAALRLVQLADAPTAAGFFHYAARPSLRDAPPTPDLDRAVTYRVRRVFRGAGFPFLFPEGKSVPTSSAIYRASLGRAEVEAVEEHVLGDRRAKLHVSAVPLRPDPTDDAPPVVLTVFALPGAG